MHNLRGPRERPPGQKLSDAPLQLLSGHASKKSLDIYQHLSLAAVEEAYQQAVKWLEM